MIALPHAQCATSAHVVLRLQEENDPVKNKHVPLVHAHTRTCARALAHARAHAPPPLTVGSAGCRYTDVAKGIGQGVICWGGVCPPPGPPPPPPPPPSPAPPIGQCPSSVLVDTSFGGLDVSAAVVVSSAAACCALCEASAAKGCVQWAWHTLAKGKWEEDTCHLHGVGAQRKHQAGTVTGWARRSV